MNENPSREELLASITVNSQQINADDLLTGPITVTIEGVSRGTKEQPIIVELVGNEKKFMPCKTCRRILIAMYSDDPKAWVGQRLQLFCDPTVMFGGVAIGGVRISHMSGLNEPRTFMLNKSRGKKSAITILPLKDELSDDDKAYIQQVQQDIRECDTMEMLKAVAFLLEKKPKTIRDALRPAYAARMKELSHKE